METFTETTMEMSGDGTFEYSTDVSNTTGGGNIPMIPQRSQLQVVLGYVLTATIAVVMVGMGCGVEFQKMKGYILKPTGVIVGIVCQFVIMPVVAFALAKVVQMNEVETIALLLVGSCPGGTTSNIATYWVLGDMDLSITMTTVSTTLGLGAMPLLLYIYTLGFGSNFQVPFDRIGIALATLVGPIIIGMCIRIKAPKVAEKILKILSSVGGLAIMGIIIALLVSYGDAIVLTQKQIICAAIFPGLGMLFGYGISSLVSLINPLYLEHRQRRTICIETGVQNTQLAGAIIQVSFSLYEIVRMILFPVAYFVSQLVWLAVMLILARIYFWKYGTGEEYDVNISEKGEDDIEISEKDYKHESTNKGFVSYPESDYSKTTL